MTDDGGDFGSDGIDCHASFGETVCDYANNKGMVKITEAFDFVLIDCPPALSLLTYNALTAASSAVLPVQLEPLATKGIAEIINAINGMLTVAPYKGLEGTNIDRDFVELSRPEP